jgi:xylan 1,4-beta-xylosidase
MDAREYTFTNPIISGFHPDPTICRVNEDYYLATSSFEYFPGIPIFHSKDLMNWRLIGHAMDRLSQLPLKEAHPSGGLFAPTMRHHNGVFYMICTNINHRGNFIITAINPAGPWSEPHYLENSMGIDPSLFFDEDGRCWYTGNGDPAKSLYDGHHTVWQQEIDLDTFKYIGERHELVSGGADISTKPTWIEAPHLYKFGEYYYIFAAEGGTEANHREVVFRSKSINGPYVGKPINPFITNRTMDPKRKAPITCVGHADVVQTQNGEWFMVLLACRPYSESPQMTNMGRETYLVPFTWVDGWPEVADRNLKAEYPRPKLPTKSWGADNYGHGAFDFVENFDSAVLNKVWTFIRNPDLEKPFWNLSARKGALKMTLLPEKMSEKTSPAFIGIRQRHHHFTASILLDFVPKSTDESAGLTWFYSLESFLAIEIGRNKQGTRVVRLLKSYRGKIENLAESEINISEPIHLEIVARAGKVSFRHTGGKSDHGGLGEASYDASFLNWGASGGFVGCMIGLYASSNGVQSKNSAYFNEFTYSGKDKD